MATNAREVLKAMALDIYCARVASGKSGASEMQVSIEDAELLTVMAVDAYRNMEEQRKMKFEMAVHSKSSSG